MEGLEHRRIRVQGRFLHDYELLVGPRNKGGAGRMGFYVYTPLQLKDG
jgi:cytochrome oxidase assembly protein ShyY1